MKRATCKRGRVRTVVSGGGGVVRRWRRRKKRRTYVTPSLRDDVSRGYS